MTFMAYTFSMIITGVLLGSTATFMIALLNSEEEWFVRIRNKFTEEVEDDE